MDADWRQNLDSYLCWKSSQTYQRPVIKIIFDWRGENSWIISLKTWRFLPLIWAWSQQPSIYYKLCLGHRRHIFTLGSLLNSTLIFQFSSEIASYHLFSSVTNTKSINCIIGSLIWWRTSFRNRGWRQWCGSNSVFACWSRNIWKVGNSSCFSFRFFSFEVQRFKLTYLLARKTCLQTKFASFSVHYTQRNDHHNYADYFLYWILFRADSDLQRIFTLRLCNNIYNVTCIFACSWLRYYQKDGLWVSDFIQTNSTRKLAYNLNISLLDVYLGLSGKKYDILGNNYYGLDLGSFSQLKFLYG